MSKIEFGSSTLIEKRQRASKAWNPTPEQILGLVAIVLEPDKFRILNNLSTNRAFFREGLAMYRQDMTRASGQIPSRPTLCAKYMLDVLVKPHQEEAVSASFQKDLSYFAYRYDFAWGETIALTNLFHATLREKLSKEQTDDLNRQIADTGEELAQKYELPLSHAADYYLRTLGKIQNQVQLLEHDPSGSLLLETFVTNLKRKPSPKLAPFMIDEFVTAGAELVQDTYQRIYPLS